MAVSGLFLPSVLKLQLVSEREKCQRYLTPSDLVSAHPVRLTSQAIFTLRFSTSAQVIKHGTSEFSILVILSIFISDYLEKVITQISNWILERFRVVRT